MFAQLLVTAGLLLPLLPPILVSPPVRQPPVSQRADDLGRSSPPSQAGCLLPEAAAQAREIAQLRQALSIDPLAGSLLEGSGTGAVGGGPSTEGEFRQALDIVLGVQPAHPTETGIREDAVSASEPPLPALLRDTSRELDDLANDREEQRDYATADRLRELSSRLRGRARRLDGTSPEVLSDGDGGCRKPAGP